LKTLNAFAMCYRVTAFTEIMISRG